MVGQRLETVIKPSRSDEVVDPQQQVQITDKIKAKFESMTPKRPVKPNRSEPDPDASLAYQPDSQPIPELQKLISLKSDLHQVGGEWVEQEEFVETQYYKQLESIDKQHHTTGTGFIKATKDLGENGDNYKLNEGEMKIGAFSGYKSNPATNDWIPTPNETDQVGYATTKPSRSG